MNWKRDTGLVARWIVGIVLAGTPASGTEPPKRYECHRAASAVRGDGRLTDAAWRGAPWSDWFVDIRGGKSPRPRYRTRVKMLWDDKFFYVAAQLAEPNVWATLT